MARSPGREDATVVHVVLYGNRRAAGILVLAHRRLKNCLKNYRGLFVRTPVDIPHRLRDPDRPLDQAQQTFGAVRLIDELKRA